MDIVFGWYSFYLCVSRTTIAYVFEKISVCEFKGNHNTNKLKINEPSFEYQKTKYRN